MDGNIRVVDIFLLMQLNFLRSNFWRCASARAVTEKTSSEELREGLVVLLVIVMSAPMVEYGHWMCIW